jgi:putative FmdB family regulatory protein
MPLYEFKCQQCNEIFELLVMSHEQDVEMKCPHCGAEAFERVLSTTHYAMGGGAGSGTDARPAVQTRTCSGGSCTTYDIPGPA